MTWFWIAWLCVGLILGELACRKDATVGPGVYAVIVMFGAPLLLIAVLRRVVLGYWWSR